jgi:hypothetical protein
MLAENLLAVVLQTKAEQVPPPSLLCLDETRLDRSKASARKPTA